MVCGTVSLYDVNVELNENEIKQYRTTGPVFITELTRTVQCEPKMFASRAVGKIPGSSEAVQRWRQANEGKL